MRWSILRTSVVASAALSLVAGIVSSAGASASSSTPTGPTAQVIIVLSTPCGVAPGTGAPGTSTTCTAQAPILAQLASAGATVVSTTTLIDTITATVTPAEQQALTLYPGVQQVLNNDTIPETTGGADGSGGIAFFRTGWRR